MVLQLPPGVDLCQIPATAPPPGVVPNFDNPASLATAMIAVSAVMLTFSTIFVAARVWMNFPKYKMADYFAIIGFVLNAAYTGVVLSVTKFARHQWDIPACWYTTSYMKILFVQGVLLGPVIFFSKVAILLLYLQIFSSYRTMRILVYIGIVVTALTYWTSVFLEFAFGCPRPGDTWSSLLTNGQSSNLIYYGPVQGSLAVIIDIYIFVLPLPVLWKLNMSLKRRIGLCAVFFTALMAVIASVIALKFRVSLFGSNDLTWIVSQTFICIIVENNVALVICCVPAFKNMWKKYVTESRLFKTLSSKIRRTRSSTGDGKGDDKGADKGDDKQGGPQLAQGYGLNRGNSKEPPYEQNSSSEKNLRRFVSHGQGAGSYESSSYSSRVVRIQGGSNDSNRTPDFADAGTSGIVRNFDITQEIQPEHAV